MTSMKARGIGLAALVAATAVVPWLVGWSALPSEVATHFELGGTADGHMGRTVAALSLAGGAVVLSMALAAVAGRVGPMPRNVPATIGFVAALLAMVNVATVAVNHGQETWRDAELPWPQVAVILAFGAAVGMLVSRTVATVPSPRDPATAVPAMAVAPGESAAWFGGAHNRWLVSLAVLHVIAGVLVLLGTAALVTALVLFFVAAAVGATASVRVVVNRAGVTMTPGLAPWPRTRIELDEIEVAAVTEVRPTAWSGWGYRGGVRTMGEAAWIVRRGPALEIRMTRGRRFVVTVDEPDGAAALLNGLRAAR